MRKWLNKDFVNNAFTRDEQNTIIKVVVDNSEAQGYGSYQTKGGNNTFDQVFLLSYQEAFKKYFTTQEDRKYYWYNSDEEDILKWSAAQWWLRSPGKQQDQSMIVSLLGNAFYSQVSDSFTRIRPALWIDLNSSLFQSI